MFVRVMNRKTAKAYSKQNNEYKTAIISITDIESENNDIDNRHGNIRSVLFLHFDDVEGNNENCMDTNDAKKIMQFVNANKDKVDGFIVHCDAGVSRSAGVAAAIMKYLINDDTQIFNNPRYCPNMHCYRMVLNAFFGEYDDDEIKAKEAHNIELWLKANDL